MGRNFLNNVTLLDTTARGYSVTGPELRPIIALFDFIAAFPSVLHQWLFLVLTVCDLPTGMIHMCESMYWLAQGVAGSFLPLSADRLIEARTRHLETTGCAPDAAERPSDDQLSALSAWHVLPIA